MRETTKRSLTVDGPDACDPQVGRLLWMLQESRQRTLRLLRDLGDVDLDWAPAPRENSIGALLYHIAAIEADWLYVEVLEAPFPPDVVTLFPEDVRDETGQLAKARGFTLEDHLRRLDAVRAKVLEAFRDMPLAELQRPRDLPEYVVTPEWVMHHLMQHEAEHRGEIGMLRWLRSVCDQSA